MPFMVDLQPENQDPALFNPSGVSGSTPAGGVSVITPSMVYGALMAQKIDPSVLPRIVTDLLAGEPTSATADDFGHISGGRRGGEESLDDELLPGSMPEEVPQTFDPTGSASGGNPQEAEDVPSWFEGLLKSLGQGLAEQRNFNSAEAAAAREWSEMMSNTSYQRARRDLEAAGFNPMLAIMSGQFSGASTPSAAYATSSAQGDTLSDIITAVGSFLGDVGKLLDAFLPNVSKILKL